MSRSKLSTLMIASAAIAVASTPARAGEITGNGKDITINSRSECAFSGRNDTPEGVPGLDPGGVVQSYGHLVSLGWVNPQDLDPNGDEWVPQPGYACNPNRGNDLHSGE